MKKAPIFAFFALCLAAQIAVAQCPGTWQPMPSGLNTDLRALHFPTAKEGWAVGATGKIIHSTDGGLTWGAPQTSGTANMLQGVHFISASTGWAVGHRGIILKTSNSGSTWVPQNSNTETDLFDVWFADAQNGWVVGACGLILRTTDGGQQWAQVSSGKDYNIRQIKVLPNGKGFTTTTGAALIATANSGANWNSQTTAPRNFRGMDLDASGLAFAASKDGALLKSTDYGGTWAAATGPTGGGNWEALSMVSATSLVLAGQQGKVFRSTDGSASWTDFHTGLDSTDIFGLQMSGDTLGWAVGEGGKVFRFVCDFTLLPDMVAVLGGTFDMGCFKPLINCQPEENPIHMTTVLDFKIGKHEVTQAEWAALMADISPDSIPYHKSCGGDCPMEKVSWLGAAVYCNRLSEQNGLAPCYYADTAFTQVFGKNGNTWSLPNSGTVHWKKDAGGYRLPTEAEWEYAARGGAQSKGYRYAGGDGQNAVAWYDAISNNRPHAVMTRDSNELGIFDMSGNVWEICWDWFGNYTAAAACSPIGPDAGTKKMARGGSFDNIADMARVSYRDDLFPKTEKPNNTIGFRLAQGKVLPNCTSVLIQPANGASNVPANTVLRWAPSNSCVSGYRLSLGTTPGGTQILNNATVTDTFYQAALPAGSTVYARIVPFNGAGEASGCGEFSFGTADEVVLDTIPPCIVWQKVLGGNLNESGHAVVPTQDGGYIVAGGAFSTDGDVSGNHGGADAWVIKLDSVGSIQWKHAYGGTQDEEAFDIEAAPDGGYIFTGYTMSKDGDVSKNQGGRDVWVVKTDATGNIQWQKTYGGGADETASTITTTSDGGFLVAGNTLSSNGDVSGHHGAYDGWVFKLDQSGNLQWQRPLGGSSNDYINSPQVTPDGEYILAGFTLSNNGDVTGNQGGGDAWMVKLTSNGVLTWQKAFGGSGFDDFQSIVVNTDGTYVAAGFTSSNDGDVSGNHGDRDVWMVKTSATGQLLWQHCFGGSLRDAASKIQHTADQGYILSASTASTDGNVTGHHSATDAWVVKTTSSGKLQWQKCLGGTGQESTHHVAQHTDGAYSMVGYTDSNDGDVSGNHGLGDLWVIELSQINASISPDTTLCLSSTLTLTASGGSSYQWSDGGPATAQWTLTPTATKTYTVTVTTVDGCTAVDSVKVTIQSDLNCGLVAHYNFDGDSRDTSGQNNHGNLNGSYYWGKDRFGNCGSALHLNGFSQKGWVRVPNSNSLKFNANKQMTLSLWVELDTLAGMSGLGSFVANGNHALVAKSGDNIATPNGFYYLFNSIGEDLFLSGRSSGAGAPSNMAFGNISVQPNYVAKDWKHIALVISPDSIKVYVDGMLAHKAISKTDFTHADTKDLLIGIFDAISGLPRWYPLQGSLDDLRLYNRALSAAEVTALYTLPNDNPNSPPAAQLTNSGKSILCAGETTTLIASPVQAGHSFTWYRDGVLITGATDSAYTAALGGMYQVRVSASQGCDSLSAPVQVGLGSPEAIALGDTLTCAKTVVILKGNSATIGVSYSWSGPNGFTSTQQNPPVNVAGTYILTVNDPTSGCSTRDTAIVAAANGLPTAAISTPNGLLISCVTDSLQLVAPTGANYTYKWSANNASTAQITVKTAGVFTLTVTDTGNGCTATNAVTVDKNTNKPGAAAIGGELPCNIPFIILTGQSGTPGVTYSWVGPNNFAVNQQNPPVNMAGTYTLTVRDPANGCTSTAVVAVQPPQYPVADITAANGQTLTCAWPALPLQASGGDIYEWSGGTPNNQSATTISQPGLYLVTVTTTANGCTGTASINISQDILAPSASVTGGVISCKQPSITLQASSNASNPSYKWSGGISNNQSTTVNQAGIYTVTVTNTQNGCTATATAEVLADTTLPAAQITAIDGATITCAKPNATLQAPPGAGYTYRWGTPGGFVIGFEHQRTFNLVGNYAVTVTNPQNGCSSTGTITVTDQRQPPNISAAGGILPCSPQSLVLQGASSTQGVTYSWVGPNGFSTTTQQPTVSSIGTYTLTVRNTATGCTATATAQVTPAAPPQVSITGEKPICPGEQIVLTAGGASTYAWSGPNGFSSGSPAPSVGAVGVYTVTGTNANGCTGTATAVVASAPPLSLSISGAKPICPGEQIVLTASGANTYAWSGPNGFSSGSPAPSVGAVGVYTVTGTNANGCTGTATAVVASAPPLSLSIAGQKPVCPGGTITLTASGGDMYNWVGPGGFTFAGAQPSVGIPGIYTVSASSAAGCTGSSTTTVVAHPAPVALLLSSDPDNTICVGEAVTFTAAGGVAYQFWRDGAPQGGFSPANTYSPSGLSSNTTISVRIVDANTCQDSTVAGDGAGREPVTLQVKTTPNISGWSLTRIPGCPEAPVRILINAPNIQTGAYWFDWELDAQPVQTLQQNFAGGVGILDIGVQPAGSHLGRISNIRLGSNGCPTTPPGGSSVGFEVKPLIATTLDTVICAGQSVKVGSQVFTQTGSYQVVLPTATAECDSTVTLELQVVTVFQIERTARICYKGTYIFYGDTLKSAGFYQKTIPGTFGCDSLIRLVLTEESPVFDFLTKTICPGTAFTVGDSIFTQPGTYTIPLKSKVTGCDSTLILTIKWPASAPVVSFPADSLRVCSGASLSLAPTVQHCSACKYKWNNGAALPSVFVSPTANTTYSVTVTDPSSSCTAAASVTLLPIAPIFIEQDTLLCPGEKLKWCGKDIAQAGDYPCTFQTAEGCDSTVTLRVGIFSGNFDAVRDSLSLPLGVLQQDYDVEERLLQNDLLSGDYEVHLVQQPNADSVALLNGGTMLRYLLRTGPRFGVDSFRYAICPPNGCTALCDSAWVRVRLQNGDLDWVQSHMPSLVTPEDGDDLNPVFDPLSFLRHPGSIFPDEGSVRFYVMSRWGEVVHRPYPYEPWDGTQGRSSLPQATYYYRLVFEIGGEKYELKGPINLLR